jgi:hypothetical protein
MKFNFIKEIALIANETFLNTSLYFFKSHGKCFCLAYGYEMKWADRNKDLWSYQFKGLDEAMPYLKLYGVFDENDTPHQRLFHEELFFKRDDEIYITERGYHYLHLFMSNN